MHNIIKRFRETEEISVHKGQGRRPLLDARGLRALRRHCITHRQDSVIDIAKWAQEYFQKPLSVNTIRHAICRCQLKLYHAKRKPYVNMVQKRRHVLWAKAHLKWTVSKWKSVQTVPLHTYRLIQTMCNIHIHILRTHSVLLDILTVINTHSTPYVHILHYVHIYTHTVICKGAVDYT